MTSDELRAAEQELGMSQEQMAQALGIGIRSYYYRLSGELRIRQPEAIVINQMLAAHRMAAAKRNERNGAPS